MSKKTKGIYHYAIKALESRLAKIRKKPEKFTDADARIRDITDALDVLRINSVPAKPRPVADPIPFATVTVIDRDIED